MKTEPEPIIFIYLLFLGPDYGYNISKTFQAAISDNIWEDTRGRQTLKNPNLVSATLKEMGEKGLLIKMGEGRRTYYDINIDVIRSPCAVDKKDEYSIVCNGITFSIIDKNALSQIIDTLRKLEMNKSIFIKFVNNIKKFDYLTILSVLNEILLRFTYYLASGTRDVEYHISSRILYENRSDSEIKEDLMKIYSTIDLEKDVDLEMSFINIEKSHLKESRKTYIDTLIEIGYNEANLDEYFRAVKVVATGIFKQMTFYEMISKTIYMERGIPAIPEKTNKIFLKMLSIPHDKDDLVTSERFLKSMDEL